MARATRRASTRRSPVRRASAARTRTTSRPRRASVRRASSPRGGSQTLRIVVEPAAMQRPAVSMSGEPLGIPKGRAKF